MSFEWFRIRRADDMGAALRAADTPRGKQQIWSDDRLEMDLAFSPCSRDEASVMRFAKVFIEEVLHKRSGHHQASGLLSLPR